MSLNFYGRIYERLLARCPPYHFPPPWGFLQPAEDCRGPVWDPAPTLAALRSEFPDRMLWRAGVIDPGPDGKYRLRPELTNPLGAVIALRAHPKRRPLSLLTARGCLPKTRSPIRAALYDAWTSQRLARGGVLFAAPRVGEVAVLRALGFPATLATGIGRLEPDGLRELDAWFDGQDFVPAPPAPAGPAAGEAGQAVERGPSEESLGPPRVTLALLGWSPLSLAAQPSPALAHAVAHLKAARRYLGFPFAGVMAWQPSPGDLENLQFRLTWRDPRLIRELLRELADSLVDFECLPGGGSAAPAQGPAEGGCVAARAELLAALADDRATGGQSHRVRTARSVYEDMVQRDLIAPLEVWALGSPDPVIRNAAEELATVCGLLHHMSPLLSHFQDGQFERARGGDVEPVPAKALAQYLQLTARFGSLLRDLCRWMKM